MEKAYKNAARTATETPSLMFFSPPVLLPLLSIHIPTTIKTVPVTTSGRIFSFKRSALKRIVNSGNVNRIGMNLEIDIFSSPFMYAAPPRISLKRPPRFRNINPISVNSKCPPLIIMKSINRKSIAKKVRIRTAGIAPAPMPFL
ncbi:hypothetical protein FLAV_02480 [Flavobacteriales bacterium]|nr:hypothetical protein FLAV_02480 [Flavobacteriales bacterium]